MAAAIGVCAPRFCATYTRRAFRPATSACLSVRCEQSRQDGNGSPNGSVSRRDLVAGAGVGAAAGVSLFLFLREEPAFALLESDEDDDLLEKVKAGRQKKIQKRVEVKSLLKETESVQAAVYELSKVGQALDGSDFPAANSLLSGAGEAWISDVKAALSKVSSSPEEVTEASTFTSALSDLQTAVSKQEADSSKNAFFVSASALERWSNLTGFSEVLKGL